ncbi:G2/M phase-specific E3 ubiquitin-protein ligase-like [Xenia sp. Carnegie-2017]|uniref:G2/M phase-specific E3 ubiquitin-protein ligase-like n=1 Tax=Xenia sp. Carnegie-2017 TaxID=2897299 RepID=UPI001F041664|nr:G2/M phase-specific E3 ubiquitin-protein ligase-like [Xenia sp. Carnegie-2017]
MFADEIGSSEGAVDLGGPTREFLRLAVSGAFSSNAFLGLPSKKVLVMNQEAKRKNLYFQCGKLLSVSLCNGGTAGHCLSPSMYDFIVFGEENCHPCIDDVQDCEVKSIIERISATTEETTFATIVGSDDAIDVLHKLAFTAFQSLKQENSLWKSFVNFL